MIAETREKEINPDLRMSDDDEDGTGHGASAVSDEENEEGDGEDDVTDEEGYAYLQLSQSSQAEPQSQGGVAAISADVDARNAALAAAQAAIGLEDGEFKGNASTNARDISEMYTYGRSLTEHKLKDFVTRPVVLAELTEHENGMFLYCFLEGWDSKDIYTAMDRIRECRGKIAVLVIGTSWSDIEDSEKQWVQELINGDEPLFQHVDQVKNCSMSGGQTKQFFMFY